MSLDFFHFKKIFFSKNTLPLSKDYFLFASIIIVVVLSTFSFISFAIYNAQTNSQNTTLEIEAKRIDRIIAEAFDYTNRISVYMGTQIAEHGSEDLDFILNLYKKTSGSQYKPSKFFSWTLFDWVDHNNLQLINSRNGIAENPPDMSHRKYSTECRKHPWKLIVSRPAIGNPSGQWVIPAGTGVVDKKGNYLGAVVVGFNIPKLNERIMEVVSTSNISYTILDDEFNIVIQSVDNSLNPNSDYYVQKAEQFKSLDNKDGELKQQIKHKNITYTHYHKMDDYPYLILTGYNNHLTKKQLVSDIMPRFVELVGIGAFFLILLFLFRIYIVAPITELSNAADKIARGETVKRVPRTPTYETTNLAKQLIYLQSYIKRIQRIDKKLFKAKQEAERANKAKSDFLANMSHELRTPLNAIIGYSEIIKTQMFGKVGNEKYTEYAKDIYESGIHLLDLINDILDISKAEAGKFEIQEETVDICETTQECLKLISEQALQKNIPIKTTIQEDPILIHADKLRIKQIIINILSNAVKFSDEGQEIQVNVWEKNGIMISVKDNGIGISKTDIPKILEKFGHVKNSMSRQSEGTGLGLWLTKMLIEAHNGTLEIKSNVGVGTEVTVYFPENVIIKH